MPNNQNPFKPKDSRVTLIKTVLVAVAVALVLIVVSFAFSLNGFVALGVIITGTFFSAAMVYRS